MSSWGRVMVMPPAWPRGMMVIWWTGSWVFRAVGHHGVARLVVGGEPPLLLRHHPAALLRAGDDLDHAALQVLLGDELPVPPGGVQGRLVDQVLQIRPGKAVGGPGHLPQIHILRQGLVADIDVQDLLPALDVRVAHIHLPVKPAGPQQGRVQDVPAVGGGQHHHALVGGKAVHLHQQLVEGLLPLVVAAAQARAPLAAHGVDLVDEHHRRGHLLGLGKEVPDAAGAHAHVELHKVRAGDGEELHPGLPGHSLGQQGLAGARRAHQQHALGDAGPQVQVLLGLLEEADDLRQLLLLLVGAGHVRKVTFLPCSRSRSGSAPCRTAAPGPSRRPPGPGPPCTATAGTPLR